MVAKYNITRGKIAPGTSYTGSHAKISILLTEAISSDAYNPADEKTVLARFIADRVASVIGSAFTVVFVGQANPGPKYAYIVETDKGVVTSDNKFSASTKTTEEMLTEVLTVTGITGLEIKVEEVIQ